MSEFWWESGKRSAKLKVGPMADPDYYNFSIGNFVLFVHLQNWTHSGNVIIEDYSLNLWSLVNKDEI